MIWGCMSAKGFGRRGSRSKSKRYLPCVMALTGTACVSLVALKCAYLFTFDLFTFNSFTFDLTAFSNSKKLHHFIKNTEVANS